jgi:hypothetical protein
MGETINAREIGKRPLGKLGTGREDNIETCFISKSV